MSCYNRTKAASRKTEIVDLQAEITAIDAGNWPRDLDDHLRRVDPPGHSPQQRAARVRQVLVDEVAYLEGISVRVKAGELPGWEA
jgi:hypothetical protein